jgi:hypothetical protein
MVCFNLFASRIGYILRRGPVRLTGAPSGTMHHVRRFVAGDGQHLVDVGHAAK